MAKKIEKSYNLPVMGIIETPALKKASSVPSNTGFKHEKAK